MYVDENRILQSTLKLKSLIHGVFRYDTHKTRFSSTCVFLVREDNSVKKTGRQIVTFDWAIKTILRDKANFDVLEGFLTALFGRPVVILDLLESESNRRDDRDKYNRVDLLAKTGDGEQIIVEVQYFTELSYLRRLAYGTAKTMVETLGQGDSYANLRKVYSISLLYFDIIEGGDDYIYHGKTEFTGLHTHHPATLKRSLVSKQVRIGEADIFPEYYLIPLKRFTDVVRDDLDQWVYAFKNNEVPDEFTAPGIGALKEKLDYLKLDQGERSRLDKHLDAIRSEWGMVEGARWEGREEGLAKGRREERQRYEKDRKTLVKSLYDNGVAIEIIAASVGLSEPVIRRLLDDE